MIVDSYKIQFITPLFSYGAFQDQPEIRAASIRGQLHWWFRALGGTPAQEAEIFGTVHRSFGNAGMPKASKLVIRVSDIQGSTCDIDTLPHKNRGQLAPRKAYAIGTSFTLHILFRGTSPDVSAKAIFGKALNAWLQFGSLGLRATRGCGSFTTSTSDMQFGDTESVERAISDIVMGDAKLKMALLDDSFETPEQALRIMSDTIGGKNDNPQQQGDLSSIKNPLGSMRPRKTSPLRFRLVQVGDQYQIIAIWDNRQVVTKNTDDHRRQVIRLLVNRNKQIGSLLSRSTLA